MLARWLYLFAFAATGLVLAACGGADGPVNGDPSALEGDWTLVEGQGPDGPVPIVERHPITLRVEGQQWGGVAACNHYGAEVTVDGDVLTVGDVGQTLIGCAQDVAASEAAYLEAFRLVIRFEGTSERLTLAGDGVRLVYEALDPEPGRARRATD